MANLFEMKYGKVNALTGKFAEAGLTAEIGEAILKDPALARVGVEAIKAALMRESGIRDRTVVLRIPVEPVEVTVRRLGSVDDFIAWMLHLALEEGPRITQRLVMTTPRELGLTEEEISFDTLCNQACASGYALCPGIVAPYLFLSGLMWDVEDVVIVSKPFYPAEDETWGHCFDISAGDRDAQGRRDYLLGALQVVGPSDPWAVQVLKIRPDTRLVFLAPDAT